MNMGVQCACPAGWCANFHAPQCPLAAAPAAVEGGTGKPQEDAATLADVARVCELWADLSQQGYEPEKETLWRNRAAAIRRAALPPHAEPPRQSIQERFGDIANGRDGPDAPREDARETSLVMDAIERTIKVCDQHEADKTPHEARVVDYAGILAAVRAARVPPSDAPTQEP